VILSLIVVHAKPTHAPKVPIVNYKVGSYPNDLAIDSNNNVWITCSYGGDGKQGNVYELDSTGKVIQVISNHFNHPWGIDIDHSGNIWIVNFIGNSVTKLNSTGGFVGNFTVGNSPIYSAFDSSDNVFVTDLRSNSTTKLSNNGTFIKNITFNSPNNFNGPAEIVYDNITSHFWVTSYFSNYITSFTDTGTYVKNITVGAGPTALAFDSNRNIWVANFKNNSVSYVSSAGSLLNTFYGFNGPSAIVFDSFNNAFVANSAGNTVTKINNNGTVLATYNVGKKNSNPEDLKFDNDGNLWVTTSGDSMVSKIVLYATTSSPSMMSCSKFKTEKACKANTSCKWKGKKCETNTTKVPSTKTTKVPSNKKPTKSKKMG